jgi:hypothetical protein
MYRRRAMQLRLSPHVLPVMRQGLHALKPQNLTRGDDRVRFARTFLRVLDSLVRHGRIAEAKQLRDTTAFGDNVALWNDDAEGAAKLEPLPELEHGLTFDLDAVGVLLRDGRIRDDGQMIYLPSGPGTPALAELLRRLHRGIDRAALLERAGELDLGFDAELLDDLIARGAVVAGTVSPPQPIAAPAIEWLGHAYVRAISPRATAWFDPFTAPRVLWTVEERTSVFAAAVPDRFLLADYGPDAHQITQDELAIPDAIFITHQDTDHMDLGVLSLVPPNVPIHVPPADPAAPWQVDLVVAIRAVLGADRNVVVMRHGESITIGDIRVTAFPFVGEFPVALPHAWNCYLVELPDQVWALCADSAVTTTQVDWLRAKLADDKRPFGIMVNGIAHNPIAVGYRDEPNSPNTFTRLYSWYLPPVHLFDPTPACGLPVEMLDRLVRDVHLSYVFPYAHGNLPWYRLEGTQLHHSHVGSHSLATFEQIESTVMRAGARVLRLKHGVPYSTPPSSPFPRHA